MRKTIAVAALSRRVVLGGIAGLALASWLGGCTQQTASVRIVAPDFGDLPALNFAVQEIEIENLHDDRAAYPHTEGLSPHPPVRMLEQWMGLVLRPAGGVSDESLLIVRIQDASIIEEKLVRPAGLSGLFSVDQTEAYHGHILLELRASFADFEGEMLIESRASQTVDENSSLRQRQQVWVDLGNKMVRDIDRRLRESLPKELPRLLLAR